MPSLPPALLALLVCTTASATACPQELEERLDAAAAQQLPAELAKVLAAPAPLAAIVDALIANGTRTGALRARPLRMLAETRRSRSEEHTSELQSQSNLVCRLLLEKKKKKDKTQTIGNVKKM